MLIIISFLRYVIDIGCGNGDKVSVLQDEFIPIGLDMKHNILEARQFHPNVKFFSIDFDSLDCYVNLPEHMLLQSVLISADVIEHIVNPNLCFLPLLKHYMQFAFALVLSTPERNLYCR